MCVSMCLLKTAVAPVVNGRIRMNADTLLNEGAQCLYNWLLKNKSGLPLLHKSLCPHLEQNYNCF